MESKSSPPNVFEFKLDPAGKEVIVFLRCEGIATGTYRLQFESTSGTTLQTREGNIETPEKHQFTPSGGLRKISVEVKSVAFFAGEPGSYRVTVEQVGGNRLETPPLGYGTRAEITIETGST